MIKKKTAGLISLYDKLKVPEFVVSHSHMIEENGYISYSVKTYLMVPLLGRVTFGSIYLNSAKRAIPFLFLTPKQIDTLKEHDIHIHYRKRRFSKQGELYVCFPNRDEIEKIDVLVE